MTKPQDLDPQATSVAAVDIIDEIAGENAALQALRGQRPEVTRYAQGSYQALLLPEDLAGVSRYERELIGLRVAVLTSSSILADRQREQLRQLGTGDDAIAAIEHFTEGAAAPSREGAILRFVDLLTLEPRAASPADIGQLRDAGLSERDVVTVAQLISYLSFQIRVTAGLRALSEEV